MAAERYYAAISGTRDYFPDDLMHRVCERLKERHGAALVLVIGDADGVDQCAWDTARMLGIPYIREEAKWAAEGKAAGTNRNERMIARAAELIAFITPRARFLEESLYASPGTCNAITLGIEKGIPVHVHHGGIARWIPETDIRQIAAEYRKRRAK